MPKLVVGQKMPDFTFDTPFRRGVQFSEETAGKKTALLFLRYYGCTLCQLDIRELKENYGLITAAGAQVMAVLQSDPEKIARQLGPHDLPFPLICDPTQSLYKRFDIAPAKSKLGMLSLKAAGKVMKARRAGLKHGEYEGDEQQLPAAFIIDADGKITYARYAKDIADIPNAEELAVLLNG